MLPSSACLFPGPASVSCDPVAASSGGGSGPVVLRLGFLANITHEPALVGLEKGFVVIRLRGWSGVWLVLPTKQIGKITY